MDKTLVHLDSATIVGVLTALDIGPRDCLEAPEWRWVRQTALTATAAMIAGDNVRKLRTGAITDKQVSITPEETQELALRKATRQAQIARVSALSKGLRRLDRVINWGLGIGLSWVPWAGEAGLSPKPDLLDRWSRRKVRLERLAKSVPGRLTPRRSWLRARRSD